MLRKYHMLSAKFTLRFALPPNLVPRRSLLTKERMEGDAPKNRYWQKRAGLSVAWL